MAKKRGIQYETVSAVASALVAQGARPGDISAAMVREETGTGSLTTIIAHLRRWNAQFQPAVTDVMLTPDSMTAITEAVAALIHAASERVRGEEREANAATAVQAERVRAERDDALALNEQIETEREAAVSEAEALRIEIEEGKLREAALRGKLDALGDTLARFERLTADRFAAAPEAASEADTVLVSNERRDPPAQSSPADKGQQLAAALLAAQSQAAGSNDQGTEKLGGLV